MYKVCVEYSSKKTVEYEFSKLEDAIEAKDFSLKNGIYAYVKDEDGNIINIKK